MLSSTHAYGYDLFSQLKLEPRCMAEYLKFTNNENRNSEVGIFFAPPQPQKKKTTR